jgi:hypothetical protein
VPSPERARAAREQSGNPARILLVGGVALLLAAVLVWFVWLGPKDAQVRGQVTLDEVPLSQAEVAFVGEGEQNQAPVVAMTNADGEYKLIGHQAAGIRPGPYKVTVSKLALKDGTLPKGEELDVAREKGLLRNMVPEAYADPEQTPLRYEIRSGQNTVNIPLKKRP